MQQNRGGRTRRRRRIDKRVDPGSRRQRECAATGEERLGRLAVDRHHPNLMVLDFDSNDSALAAIDEAKPEPLMGAGMDIRRGQPVDGIKRRRVLGIETGRDRRAVRAQPPVFDQQHLVAIHRDRFTIADDQRPRHRWARLPVAEQAEIAQEGASATQGNREGFFRPGRQRRPRGQRFGGRDAVDPAPACVTQAAQASGATTYPGSLSQIPAEAGVFDLIILSHVLEHIRDLRPALDSVRPFLMPKASLYIETPDAMRYADFVFAPFQDFNTEHINHFSLVSMTNLLHECDFTPIGSATKEILSAPDMPYPALFVFATSSSDLPTKMTPDTGLKPRLLEYITFSRQVMDEIEAHLQAVLAKSPEVIVWGTGQLALKLLADTSLSEARIDAFVDGNPLYHGQFLQGIPIIAPNEVRASDRPIIVTSILHHRAIVKKIRELNLPNPIVALRTV